MFQSKFIRRADEQRGLDRTLLVLGVAMGVSLGEMDAAEFKVRSHDEIGVLAASFTRMRRSLEQAMKMLG